MKQATDRTYPLSPFERGMFIEQKLNPSSEAYSLKCYYEIDGVPAERLKAIVEDIFHAHEAFRCIFSEKNGECFRTVTEDIPEVTIQQVSSVKEAYAVCEATTEVYRLEDNIPARAVIFSDGSRLLMALFCHHILFDGGSDAVFIRELFARLCEEEITPSPVDLSDISQEDREELYRNGFKMYEKMFADGVPTAELPVRQSRPKEHPLSDCNHAFTIDSKLLSALKAKSKECGVTVFTLLLGALAATASKYMSSEEVVIGIPTNTRTAESRNTIGMFVNTAPLLLRPVRTKAADAYIKEVSDTLNTCVKQSICPFDRLVAAFAKDRTASRHPLFDIGLNYLHAVPVLEKGNIRLKPSHQLQASAKDLNFVIQVKEDGASCDVQYSTRLFEKKVIENFVGQFLSAAEKLCASKSLTVRGVLELPEEQQRQLDSFSTEATADVPVTLLHKLFEQIAAANADKTALIAADRTLSYRELNERANIAAHHLIEKGVKKGDSVVLLLPRRSDYFAVLFGVLKAGAAFIPCDPQYPPERIRHIIGDSDARFIITTDKLIDNYSEQQALLINELFQGNDVSDPTVAVTGQDLAYMIYTSGSTGVPKGVMLRHEGVCNFVTNHPANILYDTMDKGLQTMLAVTTVSFDLSLKDTLGILCNGKTVVFADEDQMNDPKALAKLIVDNKIDAMNATPSRYLQYLTCKPFKDALRRCRLVMAGGELFSEALLKQLKELEIETIINTYGPTETTISSNMARLTKAQTVTVGRPLLNVHEYIVDPFGDLAPYGAVGELYIGGPGVAKGYRKLPEKTDVQFIRYHGMRVYRSGDYAKWDKDGNVVILGRMDGQIKLRGLRIELGEIESVIESYEGVKEVAVTVKTIGGTEHIAAYYTADAVIDPFKLKEHAASKLTHYMVPDAYMQLDEMPHTLNGKKDIRRLPEPELLNTAVSGGAPRELTRFEREICELAEKAIGVPVTDVTVSLLNLGMTSLTAIAFTSYVEEKYGCEIPVGKVMHGMSIVEAEDLIYESLMQGSIKQETAVVAEQRTDYPLTSNQLGVYYEVMKHPEELLYNMPLCCRFESVDADRLKAAIEKAISLHSYLNTHIEIRSGIPVQVRIDDHKAFVPVIDMTAEEFEKHKNKFVRPFNLHTDILYRFEIIRADGVTYLLSDVHHIVFDGLSRGILMDTVSKLYEGEDAQAEKLSYFDYALSENREKDSEAYRASEQYFSNMLKKFETVSEIPADKKGRSDEGHIGIADALLEKAAVEAYCRENAVTPSTLFLAAAFYTVSRFVNSRNVYISTISGGRSNSKIRRTVGMFVHTLPLHMSFDDPFSVGELIKRSNAAMLDTVEHESYPFMQLADQYGYSTEIMYECQLGVSGGKRTVGDAEYTTQYLKLETPKFKVTVSIEDRGDQIAVSARYNDAIYTESYMQTLANAVKLAAERMMTDPDADVRTLSLLTDEEEKRLLRLGVTAKEDTEPKLLHRMFEQSAAKYPQRTALIACDRQLSYEALNSGANIVAHQLISKGITKGDSVVLLLPRRSFYFEAMFGVLKAGAAFIPCDPDYPAERILHIIGDSGARYIITTEEHMADYPEDQALLIDSLLTGSDPGNPDVAISGRELAYMIYTSGSTGKPKGVMLRHEGICNYLTPHPANIHIHFVKEHIENYLSVTTVSFDMSFKEHTASLCSGKTLIFAAEDEMNDPRALAQLMEKYEVDCINATPSRLQQYMEYAPFRAALSKCKLVMSGGEAYPLSLRDAIRECCDSITVMNTYGPTEITVSSNVGNITNADHISIGRPLLNYSEYIVDADMNLVPQGVIGELLIGGVGVAEGYRNLPEQTEKSFINYHGERVYRSGDYAKWDENGNVIILGRMDSQVKLRGLRIELGEIEGLIDKQPHIKKSVVVIKKLNGTDNLCAYYTAECEIRPEELKQELAKSLTHYMVPTAYLQLESIPVTPNGKTDLKALPDPVAVGSGEYTAPVNDVESYFCELFQKVLHIDRVGAADDFFEIGGTSLLVTSVVIDAAEHGYEITYGDIFSKTTPRLLAQMFTSSDEENRVRIVDFDRYDYSKINELLTHNNMGSLCSGELHTINNILLTGATGYMGTHILAHFLKHESGKAYCMLRKGTFDDARSRLKTMFFYYFSDELEEEFDSRVTVYDGDVTSYDSFAQFEGQPIDTVFNCAANVKHFSNGTDIEDVNVGGAQNCVRFCKKTGARLIHFSTISVAGASVDNVPPVNTVLDEQTLYYGQRLDTKYTNSKLLAEREVLEDVAEHGLDAKVIRVGTLAARESDGEFQINFLTNNFMGRLRSFVLLGCFPYSMLNNPISLGPIDESAEAFFALAKTPKACCLFNCTNNHSIPLADIITEMNKDGLSIAFVEDSVYMEALTEAEKDPQKAAILSSMLAYKNMAHGKQLVQLHHANNYTTQALAKMGFFWKPSSRKYIHDFIAALSSLAFFDSSNLNR